MHGTSPSTRATCTGRRSGEHAIGRAAIDGSGVDHSFLDVSANSVAVDATHIYWSTGGSIGRAELDGSDITPNLLTIPGAGLGARGVAVDGTHIYWVDRGVGPFAAGSVGRAKLDGSDADYSFVTGITSPTGIAVDGQHVYWSAASIDSGSIGRAALDGSSVNHVFIAADRPTGIAVDALATIPTATTLESSKNPAVFGDDPTFTATVANTGAAGLAPGGTVQFRVNGFPDGAPVPVGGGGRATFSPTYLLNVGDAVSAVYSGDNRHAPSSATIDQQVHAAVSSTTLTSSANPATAGAEITFVATVLNHSSDVTPFGSVQFLLDGKPAIEPLSLDADGRWASSPAACRRASTSCRPSTTTTPARPRTSRPARRR